MILLGVIVQVQADDNILLRSVSNERFLSAHHQSGESDSVKVSDSYYGSYMYIQWNLRLRTLRIKDTIEKTSL